MNAEPISKHEAAKAWARAGAALNPGICFIGIAGNTMYSQEIPPAVRIDSLNRRMGMELGRKDGAEGRWLWDEDLDKFIRIEEKKL